MCRGQSLADWQAQAIRNLVESNVADLALVVVDEECVDSRRRGASLLWRLFETASHPRSLRSADVRAYFGDKVKVPASDVAAIRSQDLDFILRFTSGTVHPDLHGGARFGIWTFRHGRSVNSETPACFWEIYRGEPIVTAALECVMKTAAAGVLREGHLKVVDYLYSRSVDQLYFEIAKWPQYAAAQICNGVAVPASGALRNDGIDPAGAPSNFAVLRFLWVLARNVARRLFERGLSEEWNIGVTRMRPEELIAGRPIAEIRWLPPIGGGWAADPMVLCRNGTAHVLCEEMSLRSGKGQISATSFDGSSWNTPTRVIETATHASYPYLFEHRGTIYCVPETFEASEIALYRAREFPMKWERAATLMSGIPGIDPTLCEEGGLFWLFCTTSENSNAVLYAFFAEDLLGPWRAHRANPVKIDVRGSRPAGAPFRVGGQLYRPAQDSSRTYGGRVVIHRVTALSPTEFSEEVCTYVEPRRGTPYDRGLHTLSFAGEYCVIDGKRFVRR
jgi:hypothetical protein